MNEVEEEEMLQRVKSLDILLVLLNYNLNDLFLIFLMI